MKFAMNEREDNDMNISKGKIGAACVLAGLSYSVIPTVIKRGTNCLQFYRRKRHIQKQNPKEKNIYLTFDDGPGYYTEEILEILKRYDVKATFFMVSDFAKKYPEVVRRVQREGHAVGMHSRRHKNPMFESPLRSYRDLQQGYMDMQGLGAPVKMFRPPWGIVNMSVLFWQKQHGLTMHLWNVMTEDWRGDETAERIADKLMRRVKPGSIICLHDGRGKNNAPLRTAMALEIAIPKLEAQGYRFVCLSKEG